MKPIHQQRGFNSRRTYCGETIAVCPGNESKKIVLHDDEGIVSCKACLRARQKAGGKTRNARVWLCTVDAGYVVRVNVFSTKEKAIQSLAKICRKYSTNVLPEKDAAAVKAYFVDQENDATYDLQRITLNKDF